VINDELVFDEKKLLEDLEPNERTGERENSNQLNNLSSIFIRIVGFPQTQPPR